MFLYLEPQALYQLILISLYTEDLLHANSLYIFFPPLLCH